jgi:oligopeptide/dipeptide ABC transporter ATP-binding protein
MYAGRVVETAPTERLFEQPTHPYTEGLLAAVPRVDAPRARLHAIPGQVPAATAWPSGCRFRPRCPYAWDKCLEEPGLLETGSPGHTARCWLVIEPERRRVKP